MLAPTAPAGVARSRQPKSSRTGSSPSKTMRILLIEDDPTFVQHVEGAVQGLKAEFVAKMTAREGLKRLYQGDIDIVIVDGLLPDKTGIRIIEDLRARRFPGKIVFLSAFYNDVRSFRKLTALGVDLVLQKPISQTDLETKLKNLMPQSLRQRTMETDFTEQFASLQEEYLEKLQLVWAPKFQALLERAENDDPTAMAEIGVLCHKLRGTAGIYKQQHIGEAAARLDTGLKNRELSRLLPEMKDFLHLLRTAGGTRDAPTTMSVSLAMRCASALVVTTSDEMYASIAQELAALKVTTQQAVSQPMALRGVIRWRPDVLLVDASLIDPRSKAPVLHGLVKYMTGIPIVAIGATSVPAGVESVSAGSGVGDAIVRLLESDKIQPFASHTLLVCDQNSVVTDAVTELFAPFGIRVQVVTTPDDYLAELEVTRPSVVLLDVAFGNRGLEFLRLARDEPASRDIPTIVLSAQTTLAERQRAYRTGAVAYVQKPIANEHLASEVTRCLRELRLSRFAQSLLPF